MGFVALVQCRLAQAAQREGLASGVAVLSCQSAGGRQMSGVSPDRVLNLSESSAAIPDWKRACVTHSFTCPRAEVIISWTVANSLKQGSFLVSQVCVHSGCAKSELLSSERF